jgi:ABC-type transport system involved in multi-copper enzyme maturation permease subunit
MTGIRIVVRKEIAELFGQKKNLMAMLFTPLLVIGLEMFVYIGLIDTLRQVAALPLSMLIPGLLDLYGFDYSLSLIVMMCSIMAADMFITEKTRKSIEVTLTTPMKPSDILIGKTVAAFAISYPISVGSFLVVVAFVWVRYGPYLPNTYTLLYMVTLLPAIAILILALTGAMQLGTRYYKAAGGILTLVMMLTILVPTFFAPEMPGPGDMYMLYGLICVLLGAMMRLSQRLFDKEKVVTTGG